MATYDVFPDSEYLAVSILKDDDEGTFGSYSPRIGTKVPANPVWTDGLIQVTRIGGMPRERHRLDRANIQVDVWHENKADAHDIAQAARVVLHLAEGQVYTKPVSVLTGVEDALGLHWQFDTLSLKPRYIFAVYFYIHAA